jgi:nitroreductase
MNATLQTLHSLRTIHGNFSSKEIQQEDLNTILDACVRAANASARQSYSIIVIEDKELMKKLCGYGGSKALLFCVDYTRIIDVAAHLDYDFYLDGVTHFVTGSVDTAIAAQTAVIAAKSLGIDSLLTNGIHRGDMTRVYDLLNLPKKGCFPLIMLVLGYPKEEPEFSKGRLRGAGVIHHGMYRRATPEEQQALVQQYDDPEQHLGLLDFWKKEEFEHYLDWFYVKWSGVGKKPQGISQMCEILKNIGFWEA